MPRVFFITGTSTGFGHCYTQEVLDRGDHVVATARNISQLQFRGANEENYLATPLEVTEKKSIEEAFDAAIRKFGRIDVVVNNAGYGLVGCFEEYTESQIRQQMEVNFFGVLNVTRTAMQYIRDNQTPPGGLIQQVTSMAAQIGFPTYSIYCASKWAVEGFTEAVSHEVKSEWRIKFTLIEPGGFRTDWTGRSVTIADRDHKYDHLDSADRTSKRHGTQPGDPVKAAKAMYELAVMTDPPLRVILGSDAHKLITAKLERQIQNCEEFSAFSNSTDVDGYVPPQ
ncbi:hypothetical protein LTR10_023559 [Elasticomyces elasticus]|uniref:Uncharacterized protein n=1 Tax=Exophiala sideris TaxID=1016849 RepID=A0ABR0J6S1_9EURO|nr:hypothetical protein LTR10_023559 [Elasticomyces elasticus]KAK5028749.1 hypothetical protein LTS07_006128 [Exophiala sideris]KAK5035618.1 hypothetical protein LTR13_005747 [Exophiala sideris]KAK5057253.1 hypothetical protein LTR69_007292 [Exophiala sideris]KAK5181774.1 hypothetical protein LTR44_005974 [Eurotiomycetes sp. CCFEE 6388]